MTILLAWLAHTALVSFVSWGCCYFYFKPKFEAAEQIIEETMRENAALKVSLAAGMATPEAQRVCELTLAALQAKAPPQEGPLAEPPAQPSLFTN